MKRMGWMCVCVALIWAAAAVAQDRSGSDTRFFPNRFISNADRDRDPDLPGTRVDVLFEKGVRGVGEVQICREDGRLPWCPFMDFRCTPGDAIALIVRRGK